MTKFCANLSWLFTELPFLDRIDAAKKAGFSAVEVLFPYDEDAVGIADRLRSQRLEMALINCPPPTYANAEPGYAALPGGEARFEQDFRRAMRYVSRFRAQHLHLMAGVAEGPEARQSFVRNLKWAAAEAPAQSLTIEPINRHDMPGYFLCDFDQAAEILDEVAAPNVNLQFDAYHAQRIHGDALAVWAKHGHRAVHVQVAQVPHRSEPDAVKAAIVQAPSGVSPAADGKSGASTASPVAGGIDYRKFFQLLDESDYQGWVSGEYRPRTSTSEGLAWIEPSFWAAT